MFKDYCGGKFIDEYKDYDKPRLATPPLPPEEQLAKLVAAFKQMAQTIQSTIIPTMERLYTILTPVVKTFTEGFLQYPNKRVLYLARHGNWRTRKKNIKRIVKWIEKGRHKECLKG